MYDGNEPIYRNRSRPKNGKCGIRLFFLHRDTAMDTLTAITTTITTQSTLSTCKRLASFIFKNYYAI